MIRLIRWKNLLFLAATIWMLQKMIIVPVMAQYGFEPTQLLHGWEFVLLAVAIICNAAAGYTINDYFDAKIDAINRPDDQIVTRVYTRQQTMRIYQILTAVGVIAGIICAILLRSWTIGILIVFVPGLLWFYSSSYKRMLIVGNLVVALTTALVPLMIAFANIAYLQRVYTAELLYQTTIPAAIFRWMLAFALFAFILTLIREIIKDIQDQNGDREFECHSLPIVIGTTWTKVVVYILMALTIFLLTWAYINWIPFDKGWGTANMNYILSYAVLWILMIIFFAKAKRTADYALSSAMMKILMAWGMVYCIVFYIQTLMGN